MAAVWEDVAEIPTGAPNLAADAQMTVNWTLYRSLPTFDMRNGMVEDVSSILVRATIAPSWHWVPVVGMPPDMAMQHLDAYIRSHHYHLATNAPNDYSPALIRKIAIILGTMRAAATTYYRITPADMMMEEVTQPYLRVAKTAGGEFVYSAINAPTAEDPHMNLLIGALSFTRAEQNAIAQLVKCGMGMVPMQGYSLVMTGQHYLSSVESQSRKVFRVPEKAYWVGNDVKEWFSSDMASIQDAAWHKAGHPISMNLKIDRARDIKVKDMLIAAGAAACASRLPAVETELRTASSYESLMKTVSPMFEMCGGSVDVTILSRMIQLVSGGDHPVQEVQPHRASNSRGPPNYIYPLVYMLHLLW